MTRPGGGFALALGTLLLMGCSSDARLAVHMGRPMSKTVAASEGYEPHFLDERGDAPLAGPRGTALVSATDLRVLAAGETIFRATAPARVAVNTNDGVVRAIDVLSQVRVPLTDGPALVDRVRTELLAQGWVDLAACPYQGTDAGVWARCTEPWTPEDGALDVAGTRPRSARMHLEHTPGVYLQLKVRCSEDREGGTWYAEPVYRFSDKPTCIDASR